MTEPPLVPGAVYRLHGSRTFVRILKLTGGSATAVVVPDSGDPFRPRRSKPEQARFSAAFLRSSADHLPGTPERNHDEA